MQRTVDVAIVGAGIVGLAHAWSAARLGLTVAVFERGPRAEMASIRNFGMVWPIGQPPGDDFRRAMRSRSRWLELKREAGLWVNECGSIHVAHAADEFAVLDEFAAMARQHDVPCELLSRSETLSRFPAANADGLHGSLYSTVECCVDPRVAIAAIPEFLADKYGVEFHFRTAVAGIEAPIVCTSAGDRWQAGRVLICSGADFESLFPREFAASGLRRCKLQMLATAPQPNGWNLGPHWAAGLTLAHYAAFRDCPTLPALKARFERELPECVATGIHVMASQNHLGEVVIGDSHEYDDAMSPFDVERIDRIILDYLAGFLRLPDPAIARRWHGVYAKHPSKTQFVAEVQPNVHIQSSPGGAGMTLSFGLADDWWANLGPSG